MRDKSQLAKKIREQHWFHTIDLGGGLTTKGDSPDNRLLKSPGAIPDVGGKTVLDIGAWDGKYSYEAEQAGATRVVALDHYVWTVNMADRAAYLAQCEAEGRRPDPEEVERGFLTEMHLPGKEGFDLLHEYLDSSVEAIVDDFMTMDLEVLGLFDIVLYLGVLYHMVDPFCALRRLRRVTREVAVIETASVAVPYYEGKSLISFYEGNDLFEDYGNWFLPTETALHAMCRAAGFRQVQTVAETGIPGYDPGNVSRSEPSLGIVHYKRTVVHAFA